MFTGIITDIGSVKSVEKTDGGKRIAITTALDISNTDLGASISCAGACMTVVEKGSNWFQVDVSDESLSKTTIGNWAVGHPVNLEMALKMGDELGGHIVSGHVDGQGRVKS
ncbi:MAG: riboflavin synthase, partial [Rhodospirillaceae bacterium]|nr:riboflavin synthase [Rhodospirillaceae bacterium]